MPKLSRRKAHGMDLNDAKATVEKIVNDVKDSYPSLVDKVSWNSDKTSAKVTGKMFKGDFAVNASEVTIDLSLSMLAKPFMGKVEKKIDTKIAEYFPG